MDFSEKNATAAVVASLDATPDARLRELLGGIVTHLHDFVRKTGLPQLVGIWGLDRLCSCRSAGCGAG